MTDTITTNFSFVFRNTDSSEAIKEHARVKLEPCLKKFLHKDAIAHLIFKIEHGSHIAEITFHAEGKDFACKTESADLYASIDKLADVVSAQLRKHKEKMLEHHG